MIFHIFALLLEKVEQNSKSTFRPKVLALQKLIKIITKFGSTFLKGGLSTNSIIF
jgi:hypothetical protein